MTNADEVLHIVFERLYPSANAVLLLGPMPVLVDPGFGSDVSALEAWLVHHGVSPHALTLIVNTHYHSDHVGANHALQERYGLPVAAHAEEAALVNQRDASACAAEWLRQPVESYVVDRSLGDGDVIDTGATTWRVLHTPGHTRGHISLFDEHRKVLIVGDAVHADDIGWLNPALEGDDVLDRSIDTLTRLRALNSRAAVSGHGPMMLDPSTAIDAGRRRLERWRTNPEACAWHAAKRIFAYALMIEGGLHADDVDSYLSASPWVRSFAAAPFRVSQAEFCTALMTEMLRSGAAQWQAEHLVATALHTPTNPSWPRSPTLPSRW